MAWKQKPTFSGLRKMRDNLNKAALLEVKRLRERAQQVAQATQYKR